MQYVPSLAHLGGPRSHPAWQSATTAPIRVASLTDAFVPEVLPEVLPRSNKTATPRKQSAKYVALFCTF
jgi:hypothetical protein